MTKEKNRIYEIVTLGIITLSIVVMMCVAGISNPVTSKETSKGIEYRGVSIIMETGRVFSESARRFVKGVTG